MNEPSLVARLRDAQQRIIARRDNPVVISSLRARLADDANAIDEAIEELERRPRVRVTKSSFADGRPICKPRGDD